MRAHIAQRTGTCRCPLCMPVVGLFRVEQVILVVPPTKVNQLTNFTAGNNLAGQLGWILELLEFLLKKKN